MLRLGSSCVARACTGVVVCAVSARQDSRCDAVATQVATQDLRRRLTPLGRLALLSETASNPSVPVVLLRLAAPALDARVVADDLGGAFAGASMRFRSRLDADSQFVAVTDFDPRSVVEPLTGVVDEKRAIAEALLRPFDEAMPRWGASVWQSEAGGSSVLLRAHHALADGVSLATLLTRATDQADEIAALTREEVAKRRGHRKTKTKKSLLQRLAGLLANIFKTVAFVLLCGVSACKSCVVACTAEAPYAAAVRAGAAQPARRSVAWRFDAFTVEDAKRVAKQLGGERATLNDLFAALVAGAVAKDLSRRGHAVPASVCAAVPIHLFGGALPDGVRVGNHIGAALVALPLPRLSAEEDCERHVRQVARSVGGSLRGGTAAVSAYCAGALCGWLLPRPVLQCVMQRTSGTATVALSNVRGPPLELSLRGRQITEIAPFLPPPPGCPIGCALVTLGGKATLSVNADAKLFDAEQLLTDALDYYRHLERGATARDP